MLPIYTLSFFIFTLIGVIILYFILRKNYLFSLHTLTQHYNEALTQRSNLINSLELSLETERNSNRDLHMIKGKYDQLEHEYLKLSQVVQNQYQDILHLKTQLTQKEQEVIYSQQHIQKLHQQQQENYQQFKNEFQLLTNDIIRHSYEEIGKANQENVSLVLQPIKEQIEHFRKKLEESYNAQSHERKHLSLNIESLKELNKTLSQEAHALTTALSHNTKAQGMWGEMVLENILFSSGLKEGENYSLQYDDTNNEGQKIRPDAVIHLPDNKKMVIDAKASLSSWIDYHQATNDTDKQKALIALLTSIKNHILGLSKKRYESIEGAFDYVFMFIPIEGAYLSVLEKDRTLFDWALQQKIILVTASSLISTLRTVHMLWRAEKQNQNALLIAKEAGLIYDKLHGFMKDFEGIKIALEKGLNSYDEAYKKLSFGRGNALSKLEKLKSMGATPHKNLSLDYHFDNDDS